MFYHNILYRNHNRDPVSQHRGELRGLRVLQLQANEGKDAGGAHGPRVARAHAAQHHHQHRLQLRLPRARAARPVQPRARGAAPQENLRAAALRPQVLTASVATEIEPARPQTLDTIDTRY